MTDHKILYALELFEKEEYKNCVEAMIECYNAGIQCGWIEEFFYSNFILPNEDEFKAAFNSVNRSEIKYEQCLIDFIPVSESEYYLFDKANKCFCGSITIDDYEQYEQLFESAIFPELWDIRIFLASISRGLHRKIYSVIKDDKGRLTSFFKIPQLKEICKRIEIFSTEEEFAEYFRNNTSVYIPRIIISENNEHWYDLINNIHFCRVKNVGAKRDNIFISICIPSYNRGHRALDNVKDILQLPYDSEIEVIVSDNGSTERTEGYEEISRMSHEDSRIVYDRIPVNDSYFDNICNVISLAKGKYVLTLSDEDHINLPIFESYIAFLYSHPDLGIGCFSGEGDNIGVSSNLCITDKAERCLHAIGQNYISGLTINNDILRQKSAVDTVKKLKDNRYVFLYTHCAFAAIAAEALNVYCSDIRLCIEGSADEMNIWGEKKGASLPSYVYPEDRVMQLRGIVDFFFEELHFVLNDFIYVMFSRIGEAYRYMEVLFYHHGSVISKELRWDKAFETIYYGIKDYIKEYKGRISENVLLVLQKKNEECYMASFRKNPVEIYCESKEEILSFQITYMMMRYLYEEGKTIEDLDYDKIKACWQGAIREV